MRNPDRWFWRAWDRFVRWMDDRSPRAPHGEGWCMYCVRNGGRTLILNADGVMRHVQEDHETGDHIRLQIGSEPPRKD